MIPEIILPCLDEAAALPGALAGLPPGYPAPSWWTTAPPTARPRWPPRTAPGWCANPGAATAPPCTPGCSPPVPSWSACSTRTARSTRGSCPAWPGRCWPPALPTSRRRPPAAGAPGGPWHARAGNAILAAGLRHRGVPVHDLSPSGWLAARPCWTSASRTGPSATRWSCCFGPARRDGGSPSSRFPMGRGRRAGRRSQARSGHGPGDPGHVPGVLRGGGARSRRSEGGGGGGLGLLVGRRCPSRAG